MKRRGRCGNGRRGRVSPPPPGVSRDRGFRPTGDPGAAAKKGAEDGKQTYSGNWKGIRETMVFSVNHQVAPKSEALKCDMCHGANGIVDFGKLGYGEEKIQKMRGNP